MPKQLVLRALPKLFCSSRAVPDELTQPESFGTKSKLIVSGQMNYSGNQCFIPLLIRRISAQPEPDWTTRFPEWVESRNHWPKIAENSQSLTSNPILYDTWISSGVAAPRTTVSNHRRPLIREWHVSPALGGLLSLNGSWKFQILGKFLFYFDVQCSRISKVN
jgi:hypothetical protein